MPTVTISILEFALWQNAFLALGILVGGGVIYRCFIGSHGTEE